jgi:methylglyoxal synthase
VETYHRIRIGREKRIACIAHDNKKAELVDWMRFNRGSLEQHCLYATRTTGRIIAEELGLPVTTFHSGPLGGDLEIGARIARGAIDFLIFFWDPLEPLPHDPDVRALLRVAAVWNVPVACNRASADFMVSSPLMREPYDRLVPPYGADGARPATATRARAVVAAAARGT